MMAIIVGLRKEMRAFQIELLKRFYRKYRIVNSFYSTLQFLPFINPSILSSLIFLTPKMKNHKYLSACR